MPQQGKEAAEPVKRPALPRGGPRRVRVSSSEREAYDLRFSTDPPMPWAQMSRRLKRDTRGIQRACERAERKIPKEGQIEPDPRSIRVQDREKYDEVVAELSHPDADGQTIGAIAKRVDMDKETVRRISKDLQTTELPMKMEVRNISIERLKGLWGTVGEKALEGMTPDKFEEAGLRDLVITAGIATDKLLLLRAQPSQTVRSEADRVKLEVLAQAFMHEAARRGYEVSADASTGVVDLQYKHRGAGRDA